MNRSVVYKIIKDIEKRFPEMIAYACFENGFWYICVDDYEVYKSKKFCAYTKIYRKKYRNVKLLFCYCKPLEKKLEELAEQDNLILHV